MTNVTITAAKAVTTIKSLLIEGTLRDDAIEDLRNRYGNPGKITNNKELATVKASLTKVRTIRTSIDKKRKQLKGETETEAQRLITELRSIEAPMKAVQDEYEAEIKKAKAEKEAKEKIRKNEINSRLNILRDLPVHYADKTAGEIAEIIDSLSEPSAFNYQEYTAAHKTVLAETTGRLLALYNKVSNREKAEREAIKESERLAKERARVAKDRAELEEMKRKVRLESEDQKITEEKSCVESSSCVEPTPKTTSEVAAVTMTPTDDLVDPKTGNNVSVEPDPEKTYELKWIDDPVVQSLGIDYPLRQEKTVTIPVSQYEQLIEDQRLLSALLEAGVDNWTGYGEAIKTFDKETLIREGNQASPSHF